MYKKICTQKVKCNKNTTTDNNDTWDVLYNLIYGELYDRPLESETSSSRILDLENISALLFLFIAHIKKLPNLEGDEI